MWVQGYFAEQDEGTTPQAGAGDPSEQVEEKLAFALGDGRVGVLAVKGRKVNSPWFLSSWLQTSHMPNASVLEGVHFHSCLQQLLKFAVVTSFRTMDESAVH